MADRGRDLKVAILSDVDKFDAEQPARQLEQLADAAGDAGRALDDVDAAAAGRDLDQLGDRADQAGRALADLDADKAGRQLRELGSDTDRTGKDLDQLATDATATARKVDGAFEAIAASSKSNLRKVDDAADGAGDRVADMSDEIKGEALEGAASFDGSMDSIKDSAQSAAAMALAAFGPIGAGIGVAAAAGFGLFRAQADRAKEAVSALVGELVAGGGRLGNDSVLAKIQELAESGDILELQKQARAAGVDVGDFIAAVAGDADALDRSTRAIEDRQRALAESVEGMTEFGMGETTLATALDDANEKLGETREQTDAAAKAYAAMQTAIDPLAEAQEAFSESLEGFTDPLGVYTELLGAKEERERENAEKLAEKTKSQSDSWEDYVKDAQVSIGEYNSALEKQVKAQEEWAGNMGKLAKRGVDEGVLAELSRMGPEAAPLVAALAGSSRKELAKWEALMLRRSQAGAAKFAQGVESGKAPAAAAAGDVHQAVVNAIRGRGPVTIRTHVSPPTAAELDAVNRRVRNGIGTIVVPVKAGQSKYSNTADNSRYRW